MELKEINSLLSDFKKLRILKKIHQETIIELDGEGSQGDTNLKYEVYEAGPGAFIKLTINSDSYGNNEFVAGLQFVNPSPKTVTVYEPI